MILINGDCLEEMAKLEDGSIDMVLTDPPYGMTACKWDSVIPFEPMWEQLKRITKDNAAIVMTASQPFTSKLVCSNIEWFRYEFIWKKDKPTNPLLCKKQPMKYHENICVFYERRPIFNPTMIKRKEANRRKNKPRQYTDKTKEIKLDPERFSNFNNAESEYIYHSNILKIPTQRGLHPTQKPVKLMEYLIKTYTNEGDTVLDFTMGSGTTGIACHNLNRNFIGIELDKEIFETAKSRIDDHTAQQKLF